MVHVEVSVTGADALPAGTVARVSIAVPSTTDVTLVPAASVIEADGDSATVYSVRDGRAVRHTVRVLFISGDRIAVQGLDGVARVVSDGAAYLRDGAAVRDVGGAR
jgi:multidrug efflux pump subunit AcrA (membrane-fusion protein)